MADGSDSSDSNSINDRNKKNKYRKEYLLKIIKTRQLDEYKQMVAENNLMAALDFLKYKIR